LDLDYLCLSVQVVFILKSLLIWEKFLGIH
jgi:hypothetical protein